MLSDYDLNSWCTSRAFSAEVQKMIQHIRNSPPSRRVSSGKKSVSGRYPCTKMGCAIQFESHKVELPGIYEMQFDKDVYEFYDQPPPIKLNYRSKNGKSLGIIHTPDFFVIRVASAGWEEWKTEEELKKLSVKSPYRYVQNEDGTWRCPPGEQYAEQYGLYYRIRSSKEINWTYQCNMMFLENYLTSPRELDVSTDARDEIVSKVIAEPGICTEQLLALAVKFDADDLYILLAKGEIYLDVHQVLLTDVKKARFFKDRETAEAHISLKTQSFPSPSSIRTFDIKIGATFTLDSQHWKILSVGEKAVTLIAPNDELLDIKIDKFEALVRQGKVVGPDPSFCDDDPRATAARERYKQASPEELESAHARYLAILPTLNGKPNRSDTPLRTRNSWVQLYRKAEIEFGNGFIGLIFPKRKGNTKARLKQTTLDLIELVIKEEVLTSNQATYLLAYGVLEVKCKEQGVYCPSYQTFCEYINAKGQKKLVEERQGPRAAYPDEVPYDELDLTTPRHGQRPLEIAHIDHSPLDVEVVSSRTYKNLGKPWMTLVVDAFTRLILAVYLTFSHPSYRSCMMAIRECVRRFGRMPQIIVSDGGADFESIYYESLLSLNHSTKKKRPGDDPKFGTIVERTFGVTTKGFINNLKGNTQLTKFVRLVTKDFNPKNNAVWTLDELYKAIYGYIEEHYENKEHPSLGLSPREAFKLGMAQYGARSHTVIQDEANFRIYSLPTTKHEVATVRTNSTIVVGHIVYTGPMLKDVRFHRKRVYVRYDPFDISYIYVYLHDKWVECHSTHKAAFKSVSEQELRIATEELRTQRRNTNRRLRINAESLARYFIDNVRSVEDKLLAAKREHQQEEKKALSLVGVAKPEPVEPQMAQANMSDKEVADDFTPIIYGEL